MSREEKIDQDFGDWLFARRWELGLGSLDVAHRSGLSLARLSSLEHGFHPERITTPELFALCDVLELDKDEAVRRAVGRDS